ncbi:MAG: zinc ABC transporter substrate-binding protein [Desulfobulbus sp.]|jgi:ABC-type Zn uptake system ZnuABC Zn-binding protein ZnuA|nr:zinc ABC transporter substrate-binding protein [Desulfobulbus sp.]
MSTIIRRLVPLLACLALLLPASRSAGAKSTEQLEVLATTFPMYLFTRGVAAGRDRIRVNLLIPAQMGCPHDYALTPQDMRRLAAADVLVINGLGQEEFLGAPLTRANPDLRMIDSSAGIRDLLPLTAPEANGHDHDHGRAAQAVNPHLFASPRQAARLIATIARELTAVDPEGAALYQANARAWGERLDRLADNFSTLAGRLANTRIVTQHGVFDYLARDMGLSIVAVVQAHAGQEPSAAEMLAIVRTIREHGAGALFTEPQYPAAIGRTIAAESDIPAATLDPVATGPEQAPADYYEQAMRANLATLERTLGHR